MTKNVCGKDYRVHVAEPDSSSDGAEQTSSEAGDGPAMGLGLLCVYGIQPPAPMPGLSQVHSSFQKPRIASWLGDVIFCSGTCAHTFTPYYDSW